MLVSQVECVEMGAASSDLAPSVSSKSLRAEFLNCVAIIPNDHLGEEMATSKPAGTEKRKCFSHIPRGLHIQYAGVSLCEN